MRTKTLPTVNSLETDHLKVIEIYDAFQGEGTKIGQACTFVRLAGCTVGCDWCDTKFSWKAAQGTIYKPRDLFNEISKYHHSENIVVSGGEPLEHPTGVLVDFLNMFLISISGSVTIETSGTGHEDFSVSDLEDLKNSWGYNSLLLSVSPKLPSANATKPFPDLLEWIYLAETLHASIQIKPVISNIADLDFFLEQIADENQFWSVGVEVIFQVATDLSIKDIGSIRSQIFMNLHDLQHEVSSRLTSKQLGRTRVLPQLHTLVYGQKRGV